MQHFDAIVIGQGLAGTTLAWQLRRRGLRGLVVDREAGGSSRIAAGLITPVTGKRLAKSWRWEELYPAAVAFYRSVEAETGAVFFHQRPSVRLFRDEAERAEFQRRADEMLAGLVQPDAEVNFDWFAAPFGGFAMPLAARLDVPHYLDVSRDVFRRDDAYRVAEIDTTRDVEFCADGVQLARLDVAAPRLVFCRGFTPDADPWFGGIRFDAAKGEILTLRVPGLAEERVVHRGIWLAPAGGDTFRAGSTYEWDDLNAVPTATRRAEIESRLREFLRVPFEVIDHRAAVRPVIDAGFPVLGGRHPRFPQLAYFNGLGSKGSLLAPYFADQLAACLAGEREVEAAVDVRKLLGSG